LLVLVMLALAFATRAPRGVIARTGESRTVRPASSVADVERRDADHRRPPRHQWAGAPLDVVVRGRSSAQAGVRRIAGTAMPKRAIRDRSRMAPLYDVCRKSQVFQPRGAIPASIVNIQFWCKIAVRFDGRRTSQLAWPLSKLWGATHSSFCKPWSASVVVLPTMVGGRRTSGDATRGNQPRSEHPGRRGRRSTNVRRCIADLGDEARPSKLTADRENGGERNAWPLIAFWRPT